MFFSCTKKVLDKLKKYHTIELTKAENGLYNWYVDVINIERKNYFIFLNSKSLFSFFIYAGTKKEHQNIESLFSVKLKEMIVREIGVNPVYIKNAFDQSSSYKYMKTNSRSMLGTMTDIKQRLEFIIWHYGGLDQTYHMLNQKLNEVPMKSLQYDNPKNIMRSELLAITG